MNFTSIVTKQKTIIPAIRHPRNITDPKIVKAMIFFIIPIRGNTMPKNKPYKIINKPIYLHQQ